MNEFGEISCPTCNNPLSVTNHEEPWFDGNILWLRWHGGCKTCHKSLTWLECYKNESVEDIEEE